MSKTCKKLLAAVLVAAMLVSTLVSGLAVSAATPGTLSIGNTTFTEGETAKVEFTVDFGETAIDALHMLADIDNLDITAAEIVKVDYKDYAFEDSGIEGLSKPELRITENNFEDGKILFESGFENNQYYKVLVTKVVLAVTFNATAAGTYPFAISIESTDYYEAEFDAMAITDAEIVINAKHEAVADWSSDADGHWHACVIEGCEEKFDAAGHDWNDGVVTTPATETAPGVKTYTCTVCGFAKEESIPVLEHSYTYKDNGDGTHTATCVNCGSITETHTYIDSKCVCGAEEAKPEDTCKHVLKVLESTAATGSKSDTNAGVETAKGSITLGCTLCNHTETHEVSYYDAYRASYVNLDLESETLFNYYVKDSTIAGAEDVWFKTLLDLENSDRIEYSNLEEAPDDYKTNKVDCQVVQRGIAAKMLTDQLMLNVFVKKDGVWYSGRLQSYSVVSAAHLRDGKGDDEEYRMYAALFTYGAKAQTYFKYRDEAESLANTSANLGYFAPYVPTSNPEVEALMQNDYTLPTIRYGGFNFDLDAKTIMNLTFRLDTASPNIPTLDQITAKVTYTLSSERHADYTVEDYTLAKGYTDRYTFSFDDLAPKHWRVPVVATLYVDGEICPNTFTTSIAGLMKYSIDKGEASRDAALAATFYAAINYGDAATAFFS